MRSLSRVRWIMVVAVSAAGLTVAPPARGATCVVPSASYPTINSATGDASCDIIKLKAGTFYENVTLPNPNVTIVGAGGECGEKPQSIIDASPGGVNATGIHVQATDVTVSKLVIRHGTAGVEVDANGFKAVDVCTFGHRDDGDSSSGIIIDGDNAVVKKSEFHSMDGAGIRLDSGATATLKGNFIHRTGWNCIMTRVDSTTISANRLIGCDDHGIKTENDPSGVVITDNVLDTVDRGIELRSDSSTITGNSITNAHSMGIQVENSDNSRVENNRINTAREDCIEVLESEGTDVISNVAKDCGDNGIQVRSEENYVVRDNVIGNVDQRCIWAENTDDVLVTGNTGKLCRGIEASGEDPVITDNAFARGWTGHGIRVHCETSCTGAKVTKNTVNLVSRGERGFEITGDAPGGLVSDNRSTASGGDGFMFEVDGWTIADNVSISSGRREGTNERNGFRFQDADGNTVTNNVASSGRDDGFLVTNDSDGNTFTGNKALNNVKDGFHIDASDSDTNTLDANTAKGNQAEGIENDGTDTTLINNVAKKNRTDCNGLDGSELVETSNTCADGSDFDSAPPNGQID